MYSIGQQVDSSTKGSHGVPPNLAYPVIHISLPQSETKDGPVEFHLGVFWTPKSDFLRKLGVPFTMSDKAEDRV